MNLVEKYFEAPELAHPNEGNTERRLGGEEVVVAFYQRGTVTSGNVTSGTVTNGTVTNGTVTN